MDVQLRNLILEPCKQLQDATPSVLLVDGLDECEGNSVQREILRLIASTVNSPGVPLRILVASRPEPHIRETFDKSFQGHFDSTNIEQSFNDVRTYLGHEFLRIHREHPTTMQNIPTPWPSPEILEWLVKNSSGYFIYASTVIKFVDDEYSRPSEQLDIIIQNLVPHDAESPFEALDQLYIQILSAVPARRRPHLCDILCVVLHYPLPINVGDMDDLLGLETGQVSLILRPLHSVLRIPSDNDRSMPRPGVGVHHASFRDFLGSQERSSIFYASSPQHWARLVCSILRALAYQYENPQTNRDSDSYRWLLLLNPPNWIRNIISVAPSPEFVPLIRLVNPDFVLFNHVHSDAMDGFMRWLKQIHPVPDDLISRWDDYDFINLYEHIRQQMPSNLPEKRDKWCPETTDHQLCAPPLRTLLTLQSQMSEEFRSILVSCQELLAQSFQLFRILQATRPFISTKNDGPMRFSGSFVSLVQLRTVLDLPWEDIRASICSLRPLVSQQSEFFCPLFLFLPPICEELDSLYPRTMAFKDLACGLLRLMRRIENGELPLIYWNMLRLSSDWQVGEWGRYVRCSPQSNHELLKELTEFVPAWDVFSEWNGSLEPVEFHDVVQWLRESPNPQPDLIDRWQGYLRESMIREKQNYTDEELEMRWGNYLAEEAYFHGPCDEKVLRCWEEWLKEHTSDDWASAEEDEVFSDEAWYSFSSGEDDNDNNDEQTRSL
ncbi:putative nwd2 protein [Mycena venus]|uniref:Putative nwd2 protein n=1 Tax=Mycena venus TaxID=2733690 RepID=A0A8H6XYY4_9AGAR|nr:putative nwd2 protein [Mycena venus]